MFALPPFELAVIPATREQSLPGPPNLRVRPGAWQGAGLFHVCCRLYFGQPFATEPIPTPRLPTMSTHRTVLDRELFVQSLRHMGEEDLLYLNRMVVERLNLLAQAKSTVALAQFAEGDRVQFTTQAGVLKQGKVMRLNKKTASLLTDDGEHWKVSPNLLRKLPQA